MYVCVFGDEYTWRVFGGGDGLYDPGGVDLVGGFCGDSCNDFHGTDGFSVVMYGAGLVIFPAEAE